MTTAIHPNLSSRKTILIIGASRGLGYAMAEEFVKRGRHVVGTTRSLANTPLHELCRRLPEHVHIEHVDITVPDQIAALRARLAGKTFDMLFVNAGVTNNPQETIDEVSTEEFIRVMVTNALSPMRAVEALYSLVAEDGLVGVMSSGQGSVSNNTNGMREVYRGSKAALNTFMRSFAARHRDGRAMVLMAPGWVRTDMGGADAPLTAEDSIPNVVNTLLAACGTPGLQYLDYLGRTVPW
jgi:NAD(P)-dependent dehydrogenase (short-subunit alcohol dehydrogenase family)